MTAQKDFLFWTQHVGTVWLVTHQVDGYILCWKAGGVRMISLVDDPIRISIAIPDVFLLYLWSIEYLH